MKKVFLFCNGGFSTSILADKLNKFDNVEASASDILNIDSLVTSNDDVIILGPQISHREDEIKQKFSNNQVLQLTMQEFGLMDTDRIMEVIGE